MSRGRSSTCCTGRCATSSTCRTSTPPTTTSSTAAPGCRRPGRGRWRRSPRSASTIRWRGSRITPRRARSISRTTCSSPTTSSTWTSSSSMRWRRWPIRTRATPAFVEPGNAVITREGRTGAPTGRLPQMPAFHLIRPNHSGISMVNIGVGPSNAKTITDHVAVLRPHVWLMVGHCAGLAQLAVARGLRAGACLHARGPCARRRPAGLGADPAARRGAGGAGERGRRGDRARRATS